MTIRQALEQRLVEHAMFPDAAQAIVDAAIAEDEATDQLMVGRWNEEVSGYPPVMLDVLWLNIRRNALTWIDANAPQHWAREVFV